jgi:alanyl-tRNA synthetase
VFPELHAQLDFVSRVVKEEEEAFLRTLDKGLGKMDDIIAQSATTKIIDGVAAFELYDTFGFPIDLTRLIAREQNLQVDEKGFEMAMNEQKNRSRASTTLDTEDWVILENNKSNYFLGYTNLTSSARLLRYRKVTAKGKVAYQLVLTQSPFYAESGGQVGDTGVLFFGEEALPVYDTRKENDLIIHFTETLPSNIGGEIRAEVNAERRQFIAAHHSATHLLHAALRQVLGTHVAQKGSLVNEEHLRFDFSHFAKVGDEELEKIEAIVNEKIRQNIPVVIKEMLKDEAISLGAMALFGEKYSERVRVVIIDPNYSIELCGGTHTGATGELGLFKIKSESAVAAGVRRIEAVSGKAAEGYINHLLNQVKAAKEQLKNPKELDKAIEQLLMENAGLNKKLERLEMRQLVVVRNELLKKVESINGINFLGDIIEISNADALKKICFDLKNELTNYIVVLAANIDGKAHVAVLLEETLATAKNLEATKIIKEQVAPLIKGGGGGQKTLATAGGQDASNLVAVIDRVRALV